MAENKVKKVIKRLSKSARTFIRRTKQASRKDSLPVQNKK
jgi:hypothetical protein